jgi:hypothetical protein
MKVAYRLSRRTMAAIVASPPRALRLDLDRRIDARRATQPNRELAYRDRQTRQILAAAAHDILLNQKVPADGPQSR